MAVAVSHGRMGPKARIAAGGGGLVDNNPVAHKAKVAVRQHVLDTIGEVRVFDAFAGSGEMYSAVWRKASSYTGCDQKLQRDERLMFCCDNRRVLRAIDLAPFNLFDLDAYGFPWEQAVIIAARRRVAPGELVGMVFTEAAGLSFRSNNIPFVVAQLAGIKSQHGAAVGVHKQRHGIFDRTVQGLARRMNCTIEKRWQAVGKTGMETVYCGVVLKGR